MKILFLTAEQILKIHDSRIELYGGSFGIREENLFLSAIQMPAQGFGGDFLHEFPFEMAAAYLFHICKNHAFIDGNKRTALAAALIFLEINGFEGTASDSELENLVLEMATGKIDKKQIANFFQKNSQKI